MLGVASVIKSRWWFTHISLFDIVPLWHNNNVLFLFAFKGWSLNCTISALFTFSFVHFANGIDLFYDFMINGNPFLRIKELLFKHRDIQHLILYFYNTIIGTSASSWYDLLAVRPLLEPLFTSFNDLINHIYVYFSKLSLKMPMNHCIKLS